MVVKSVVYLGGGEIEQINTNQVVKPFTYYSIYLPSDTVQLLF